MSDFWENCNPHSSYHTTAVGEYLVDIWFVEICQMTLYVFGTQFMLSKSTRLLYGSTASCRSIQCLEVNKCAFTFSSEIRKIQCTRTEFWCVQCPSPAGPSALDKHQIPASAWDLSYFTSKSKCKFINLIHTRQKNKIICSRSWKIINKMVLKCHYICCKHEEYSQLYPVKKMDQSMWRSHARSRTKSTSRSLSAVLAQYAECSGHFQYTLRIY